MWREVMASSAIKLRAKVQMLPAADLPVAKPLRAGWGPNIFFKDEFYPGRILECETPIEPGQSGEAIIGVMESPTHASGLQLGSVFELRDGPVNRIATAEVISFA
jgi:hypothetical protein